MKTIRGGLYILINKHLQYQCFRIYHTETHVTNICYNHNKFPGINSSQEFRIKTFRFLTNNYEAKFRQTAFSESVRISHGQHLPPKFCLLFLYARDLNLSRLTCNAILRLVYADFTSSERLSVRRNLLGIQNIWSYSTSVILLLRKIFTCPSGKLSTEVTSPIAKSTSPGLSDTTFCARC